MSSFCILPCMLNRWSGLFHVSIFSRCSLRSSHISSKGFNVKFITEEDCRLKKDKHIAKCVQLRSFVVCLFIGRWGFTLRDSLSTWRFTRKFQTIAPFLKSISFASLHHPNLLWHSVLVSMQILDMRKTHRKLISMHLCLLSWTRNSEAYELPRQIELVEMCYMMHDREKSFSCIHFLLFFFSLSPVSLLFFSSIHRNHPISTTYGF